MLPKDLLQNKALTTNNRKKEVQVYNIQSMQLESSGFSLYAVERGMLGLLHTPDLCLLKLCSVPGSWGLRSVCISQGPSQLEGENQAGAASLGP